MADFIEEEWEEEVWAIRPNKSQLKRDIAEVSDLSEEISQLTPVQVERLGLPDTLVYAIENATKMPAKSARKRQMKYVTSLMRNEDLDGVTRIYDDFEWLHHCLTTQNNISGIIVSNGCYTEDVSKK
jgi:ribosome-associated protein